jgi:hypothetical protein
LAYEPPSRGEGSLRPEIQIEEQSDVPASGGSAAGVIVRGRGFQRSPEVASIACVSIRRTAAEKFVASTRRTAAEIADADAPRDPMLARHGYDLHIIRSRYEVAEVAAQATFAAF